jgi:putative ABC transport system substrate-binding protein
MRRREFLVLLGAASALCTQFARAQQKARRIGFLFGGTLALRPQAQEFWHTLQQLGYVEGKNIQVEVREAQGKVDRLPELASEIVATHPDVLVAVTSPAVAAAKGATKTIPIVMAVVADPLGLGFVQSLARPGANVTGPSLNNNELAGKRMQLLKEMLPDLSVAGILWNETNPQNAALVRLTEQAARSIGIPLRSLPLRTPADLKVVLESAFEQHLSAILVVGDAITFDRRGEIIAFSIARRIPTLHGFPEEAVDGALAAYGPSLRDDYRRAAYYVDKILKGATPSNLPVEEPTKFEFVLNQSTARKLGLTIPPSIILRADEVIE